MAKHESEQLARRVRRKMAERAEAGQPHGRTAYGWRREQVYDDQGRRLGSKDVLHPEQAEVIRWAAAAVLSGQSLRGIVAELNARGALTLNDKPWSTTTLRLILLRERNAGRRVYQGQVVGRGDWEAVMDEDTHTRLLASLTNPARRSSPGNAVKYLLTGLARCGVCGGPMRVLPAAKDRTADTYICQHGYHTRRSRPGLDALVTNVVLDRLAKPDAASALARSDDGQAQQATDKAAAAYADGSIDGAQLARITAKLRPELQQWQELARAASTAPDLLDLATPDIAQRWQALPLARQRAVIDLLLDIAVLPATRAGGHGGFDPNTIHITWKPTT